MYIAYMLNALRINKALYANFNFNFYQSLYILLLLKIIYIIFSI